MTGRGGLQFPGRGPGVGGAPGPAPAGPGGPGRGPPAEGGRGGVQDGGVGGGIPHGGIDLEGRGVLFDRPALPSPFLVEQSEPETRRRKAAVAVHGLLVRRDRPARLAESLVEEAEVIGSEVLMGVELHRPLVLLAGLFGKAPRRQQVAEVVAQVRGLRIRIDPSLLVEDPLVQRISGHEVPPVKGLAVLLVGAASEARQQQRKENSRPDDDSLHLCLHGTLHFFGLATSRTLPSRSATSKTISAFPKCAFRLSRCSASFSANRSKRKPATSSPPARRASTYRRKRSRSRSSPGRISFSTTSSSFSTDAAAPAFGRAAGLSVPEPPRRTKWL